MSESFSINPNFQSNGFNNIIEDFNKSFSSEIKNDYNKNSEFENIFNSISDNPNENQTKIVQNNSDVAKLALDIQNGFSNSLNDLNTVQRQAESDFETFASGGDISVHEVMISAQKSNLAMQMAIQLRNQVLNAYNEFKNMSV